MKKKVGERIRVARVTKGLSQQNMADELGLTVASYSNIERGVTDITITRLFEIARILQVKATDFIICETFFGFLIACFVSSLSRTWASLNNGGN